MKCVGGLAYLKSFQSKDEKDYRVIGLVRVEAGRRNHYEKGYRSGYDEVLKPESNVYSCCTSQICQPRHKTIAAMPAKEEILEDAETLFRLVVHFPTDDDDEGDEIDSGPAGAECRAEEEEREEVQIHPSKRRSSDGALLSSSIAGDAKRPRQGPRSETLAAVQSTGEGRGHSKVRLRGGPRDTLAAAAAAGSPSSDLPQMEYLRCRSMSEDDVDGSHGTLSPETRSKQDHREIINKIAGKLRHVGDELDKEVKGRSDSSRSSTSVSLASETVEKLISDLTYDNFKEAVIKASGEDPGLQQLVCVFRLASAVASKAQNSTAAQNVHRFYTNYFTSNLADWVDSVGGWGGVLAML